MTHQSGITALGTSDHVYLEYSLNDNVELRQALGCVAAAVDLPTTRGVNVVVGIRPSLWQQVADQQDIPDNVHDFSEPIGQGPAAMPATQYDLWVWVQGNSHWQAFDNARDISLALKPFFTPQREVTGWVYQHNRDLTGFEDGTENPGALSAPAVVSVPAEQPGAGASILLFQLWEHKTREWESLDDDTQAEIIGRTKADSVELDDDVNPESSHVNRSTVRVHGESQEIFRRNVAYGDISNHGTVFVGFSRDQWRMEEMLRRMAGVDGGPADRLTEFTQALSGSWYVCPSVEALVKLSEANSD